MTIEEYDSKTPIREKLEQIDRALQFLEECFKDLVHPILFRGIGPIGWCNDIKVTHEINDDIFIQRFKELLLQRKQELINEFTDTENNG